MRRCGKRYSSEEAALRSKKGLTGRYLAVPCRCEGWHLEELILKPVPSWSAGPAGSETFSAAVCALIDQRDGDDGGAVLVRLCQRCGTTRNLHRHHRRGKDAGGSSDRAHTHCACNGVTLCRGCHAEVHAHPEQSQAEGWIVSQSEDEPASVGVMRFASAEGGATQWPSCSGEWARTAPEMREAVS
jgi:hypothetical protein